MPHGMYKIEVQYGQNIWDVAMQFYGNVDGVWYLLLDNELDSLDAELVPGTKLLIDESKIFDARIVEHFQNNSLEIATLYIKAEEITGDGLTIELDLILIEGLEVTI
jgi:hypothetical protein